MIGTVVVDWIGLYFMEEFVWSQIGSSSNYVIVSLPLQKVEDYRYGSAGLEYRLSHCAVPVLVPEY